MVWFQCEDCGENLKKPKLPNHFRICSASKLSCIDCGDVFSKEGVQSHTQCMTEAEKYGPKDNGKPLQSSNCKPEKPKKNADVDITVGLSSRPPWFCSLCKSPATSKQALLLHADGKKHRAKAKAFLSAQNQSNQTEATKDNGLNNAVADTKLGPVNITDSKAEEFKENDISAVGVPKVLNNKLDMKRKHGVESTFFAISECRNNGFDLSNGEVIQAKVKEDMSRSKRIKIADKLPISECVGDDVDSMKINWKKHIVSILKSKPDRVMKIKRLQKLVMKELKASDITGDEVRLCDAVMQKINSSSRFVINNKAISLAMKTNKS